MDNNATNTIAAPAQQAPAAEIPAMKKMLRRVFPVLVQVAIFPAALAVAYVVDKSVMDHTGFSFLAYGAFAALVCVALAADWLINRD